MYIDDQKVKRGKKSYRRVLIRESYRENGKVMTRTIANISKCSEAEVEAIKIALKYKENISVLKDISEGSVESSKSVGAVYFLFRIAQSLGILKALGDSREAFLGLWLVISRLLGAISRLAAVRYANIHAVCEVLNINPFNEDSLYTTLNWIQKNQKKIEGKLFKQKVKLKESDNIYLYDLSSSYFEGEKNELAAYGYNRDKKQGKKQVCYGLLTNSDGDPISIEAFPGNMSDNKTLSNQIEKLKKQFGCQYITIVGDKGMIKKTNIEDMKDEEHLEYITSITKTEIRSLIKRGLFQYELFDEKLAEVYDSKEKIRYILRCNPYRREDIRLRRTEKLEKIRAAISNANIYLKEHSRAKTMTQEKKINTMLKKFKMDRYTCLEKEEDKRILRLKIKEEELKEIEKLDGCYVIKTDLPQGAAEAEEIHDRYKDLIKVEKAFREEKSELDVRPIYLQKEKRTRGHLFIVMLAYKIQKYLRERWQALELTVEEGIKHLGNITALKIKIGEQIISRIPKPSEICEKLLEPFGIKIPEYLPYVEFDVVTRTKLTPRRKKL